MDNGNPNSGVEPAIAIAPPTMGDTMEAMTGAIDWRLGSAPRVGFGITFNGGLTWEEGLVDLPGIAQAFEVGADASLWGDPVTGDVWMAGLGGNSDPNPIYFGSRVFTIKRAPGVHAPNLPAAIFRTQLWTPIPDFGGDEHLPLVAAGPRPGALSDRNMYILFERIADCFQSHSPPAHKRFCDDGHMMLI